MLNSLTLYTFCEVCSNSNSSLKEIPANIKVGDNSSIVKLSDPGKNLLKMFIFYYDIIPVFLFKSSI